MIGVCDSSDRLISVSAWQYSGYPLVILTILGWYRGQINGTHGRIPYAETQPNPVSGLRSHASASRNWERTRGGVRLVRRQRACLLRAASTRLPCLLQASRLLGGIPAACMGLARRLGTPLVATGL